MYEVDVARGYGILRCKSYFRTEDGRIILSRVSDGSGHKWTRVTLFDCPVIIYPLEDEE